MLDELKKAAIEDNIVPAEDQILEILLNKPTESSLDSEELINAFAQLNLVEQQLIQLLFVERSSLDEVALHLGITKAGVKKKRERTIQKLRRILKS